MSDDPKKKDDHPIFVNVVSTVLAGVILLVCTTIYNLLLAHIWPLQSILESIASTTSSL